MKVVIVDVWLDILWLIEVLLDYIIIIYIKFKFFNSKVVKLDVLI